MSFQAHLLIILPGTSTSSYRPLTKSQAFLQTMAALFKPQVNSCSARIDMLAEGRQANKTRRDEKKKKIRAWEDIFRGEKL